MRNRTKGMRVVDGIAKLEETGAAGIRAG